MSARRQLQLIARLAVAQLHKRLEIRPRRMCLISGAPRSGTTALCRWLGSQRSVVAFSESRVLVAAHALLEQVHRFRDLDRHDELLVDMARDFVLDYYGDGEVLLERDELTRQGHLEPMTPSELVAGRWLLVDKEPLEPVAFPDGDYARFLDNVETLFPDRKLVLTIRDPLASIWSMRERHWGHSLTGDRVRRFSLDQHIDTWCACAEIVLARAADPGVYVCQYGHLVGDSRGEARRLLSFLELGPGTPFPPRVARSVGFDDEERAVITQRTDPIVRALRDRGLTALG